MNANICIKPSIEPYVLDEDTRPKMTIQASTTTNQELHFQFSYSFFIKQQIVFSVYLWSIQVINIIKIFKANHFLLLSTRIWKYQFVFYYLRQQGVWRFVVTGHQNCVCVVRMYLIQQQKKKKRIKTTNL